ncbi:MAG: Arm DNA-binding domain-containing protein [Cellvibrionales bacterium]|nr:Arm DNA-binding domain-containing protein [Cellvibrionales bacterium]
MAKRIKPLTATQVANAKPSDKVKMLSDGDGLYLRILPSGSKSWLFKYSRLYEKGRSNISFGPYPAISLAEAREKN